VAQQMPVEFSISNLLAIDQNGNTVNLSLVNSPFTLNLCKDIPLKLTSTNGNEYLISGEAQEITWFSEITGNIILEYSTDNGLSWVVIADNILANVKSFEWTIPDVSSENCKIRISSKSEPQLFDISENTFVISTADTKVGLGPYFNDGNTVALFHFNDDYSNIAHPSVSGTTHGNVSFLPSVDVDLGNCTAINNTNSSVMSNVEVPFYDELSLTGDWTIEFWFNINSWGTGSASFPFMFIKTGANYFIFLDPGIKTLHAGYDYDGGAEQVFLPNNSLELNKWYHISFIRNRSNTTLKCLLHDSQRQLIAFASGKYNPSHLPKTNSDPLRLGGFSWGSNCQFDGYADELRISNIAREFRSLALSTPNGGESLTSGTKTDISWVSRDIQKVKLEYTINNGTTWNAIASNLDATAGKYSWTVPTAVSSTCKIRISDQSDATFYDNSDAVFSILKAPSLTLTKPNGGENWQIGSLQSITWNAESVALVKLDYSADGGTGWTTIAETIDATAGSYSWVIPDVASTNCKVRISDLSNATLFDASNQPFTISKAPSLTLTHPNGGESYQGGNSESIIWSSESMAKIKLEYSINDGLSWTVIASNITASLGSYSWNVPNVASITCKIRISNQDDATFSDQSDAVFSIFKAPSLTLITPNGGENWLIGSLQNITWSAESVAKVKLDYSADGGTGWITLAETIDANAGSYSWTLPDIASANCKVRISNHDDATLFDVSDQPFTIEKKTGSSALKVNGNQFRNYPNPFSSLTHIEFKLPAESSVQLSIIDLYGREVTTLISGELPAGEHACQWEPGNRPAGLYICRLQAGGVITTLKLIVQEK
jgi:hypothetical protein